MGSAPQLALFIYLLLLSVSENFHCFKSGFDRPFNRDRVIFQVQSTVHPDR